MFYSKSSEKLANDFEEIFPENVFSMSDLQGLFIRNKDDQNSALNELKTMIQNREK